jgi:hypothetical protein
MFFMSDVMFLRLLDFDEIWPKCNVSPSPSTSDQVELCEAVLLHAQYKSLWLGTVPVLKNINKPYLFLGK